MITGQMITSFGCMYSVRFIQPVHGVSLISIFEEGLEFASHEDRHKYTEIHQDSLMNLIL